MTDDAPRYTHEWLVVGRTGVGRFVECDSAGVPMDPDRYRELHDAEQRGELTYLGIREHASAAALGTAVAAGEERSYRSDSIDGAAVSDVSLAGAMGLYRDN